MNNVNKYPFVKETNLENIIIYNICQLGIKRPNDVKVEINDINDNGSRYIIKIDAFKDPELKKLDIIKDKLNNGEIQLDKLDATTKTYFDKFTKNDGTTNYYFSHITKGKFINDRSVIAGKRIRINGKVDGKFVKQFDNATKVALEDMLTPIIKHRYHDVCREKNIRANSDLVSVEIIIAND